MIRIHKAILHGAGDLRIEEELFDPAALGANEILVRTEVTGFSTGTDLGNYLGRSTDVPGAPDYPRAVGYSNAGVVWMAGAAVREWAPGDRVFSIKPHRSAFVAEESDLLVRIPAAVPAEQAALAYLANLGLTALRQARYSPGERVAVVGLGVIGLCTVAVARAMGAPVTAVANDPTRAALARRLGAGEPSSDPTDIVVLTANTWEAYRTAVEMARHEGRIAILGFPGRAQQPPEFNPLDARWLYGKQLQLIGAGFATLAARRSNIESVLDWIASGAMTLEPVISHRIPFHRMRDAYELARTHAKELTAAVFDWR